VNRRAVALVAAGVTTAALAAGAFFLFVPHGSTVSIDAAVQSIDEELAGGYLEAARGELAAVTALPRQEPDILRLLKRAYRLGAAGGDWSPLDALAAQALRMHPRSAQIRAVAAYASLRAGRLAEADRTLARGGLPLEVGSLLKGEAALRRGEPWPAADGLTRDLVALESSDDPAAYAAAALRAGDARLSLDAAVLAMSTGRGDVARSIASSALRESRWNEPAALILFDAGDSTGALARLDAMRPFAPGRTDLELVAADVLYSLGRFPDAQAAIENALAARPDISWVPYADLSYLAGLSGHRDTARAWIARGLTAIPGSPELSLALARIEAETGDTGSAVAMLTGLLRTDPTSVDASLLLLSLQAPQLSPEAYRARMWKLFNTHPSDPSVLRDLVTALVAVQDWDGVSLAFRQNEVAGGAPDAGELLVQGMAAAMRGDADGAIRLFNRAAAGSRDGIARFDAALVMLREGRAAAALAALDAAAEENAHSGPAGAGDAFLARVEEARAEANMILNNLPAARTALEKASRLDPASLRVTLLMKKLEAPVR
jgi:tetratricopeptide (TPR) repeat protein